MSVYISSVARRAGGGSRGSRADNRGGEKCDAGRGDGLPGELGDLGSQEERGGGRGGSPGRAVYVAGCASAGGGGGGGGGACQEVCLSVQELSYCLCLPCCCTVLLQHGADPNIRNTDGKSALDLAEPSAKAVLTGQYPPSCTSLSVVFIWGSIDGFRVCIHTRRVNLSACSRITFQGREL